VPFCPAARGEVGFGFVRAHFVRSRIERIVELFFVIKGGWAERFWTVIVSKGAAMACARDTQVFPTAETRPEGKHEARTRGASVGARDSRQNGQNVSKLITPTVRLGVLI
jgi:hypothetical protein